LPWKERVEGAGFNAFRVDLAEALQDDQKYGKGAMVKGATLVKLSDQLIDCFRANDENKARTFPVWFSKEALEVCFTRITDDLDIFVKVKRLLLVLNLYLYLAEKWISQPYRPSAF
jgi:hypothetical protein